MNNLKCLCQTLLFSTVVRNPCDTQDYCLHVGTLCICPYAGVPVESYREPEKLHQQPSTTGHFYDQCQCSGHRLPDHRLFLQN